MTKTSHNPLSELSFFATEIMLEKGLYPEFSSAVMTEVNQIEAIDFTTPTPNKTILDLTHLPWCSIDNDDSLDLDQLTASEILADGRCKIYVAIADVDVYVKKNSVIDLHARHNSTSVYSSIKIFPMLPPLLSNNLCSLNQDQVRQAIVTEMIVSSQGSIEAFSIYQALVKNKAQLAYDSISAWLEGNANNPIPLAVQAELSTQIMTQDRVAQQMRSLRHQHGSLQFVTFEPKAILSEHKIIDIQQQEQNRGRQIIEEFMIATNACSAHYLADHQMASIRRVVRTPEKWNRIRELAQHYHFSLPAEPSSLALEAFLIERQKVDPLRFPDLSLVIIKLMGSGQYIVERPGEAAVGHFGLAEKDYTHSTAPNRRYPDLITQRMLKAALQRQVSPYSALELEQLAEHCTLQEDASRKVERHMRKSEAAFYLKNKIGHFFDALVTGVSERATWVRIFQPAAEGRLTDQATSLLVGQKIKVQLISTDIEKGFIDFKQIL